MLKTFLSFLSDLFDEVNSFKKLTLIALTMSVVVFNFSTIVISLSVYEHQESLFQYLQGKSLKEKVSDETFQNILRQVLASIFELDSILIIEYDFRNRTATTILAVGEELDVRVRTFSQDTDIHSAHVIGECITVPSRVRDNVYRSSCPIENEGYIMAVWKSGVEPCPLAIDQVHAILRELAEIVD